MERDTFTIFDLRRFPGATIEYVITLECFYPENKDHKRKWDIAERIVNFGTYIDLDQAKEVGHKMWDDYSKGAIKELKIYTFYLKLEYQLNNFKEFGK